LAITPSDEIFIKLVNFSSQLTNLIDLRRKKAGVVVCESSLLVAALAPDREVEKERQSGKDHNNEERMERAHPQHAGQHHHSHNLQQKESMLET
jgi:hypothetical protein